MLPVLTSCPNKLMILYVAFSSFEPEIDNLFSAGFGYNLNSNISFAAASLFALAKLAIGVVETIFTV